MRVFALILCLSPLGWAYGQQVPVKTGLWETTKRLQTTVTPNLLPRIKEKGIAIPQPTTFVERTCVDAQSWARSRAQIDQVPSGCIVTHKSSQPARAAVGLQCTLKDRAIAIEVTQQWPTPASVEIVYRETTSFTDSVAGPGKTALTSEASSRFIASDCGTLAPGAHITISQHPTGKGATGH